jgi:hypothetical protein
VRCVVAVMVVVTSPSCASFAMARRWRKYGAARLLARVGRCDREEGVDLCHLCRVDINKCGEEEEKQSE